MTREEVIEMLKKDKEQRGECFISDALDMAIKALEQQKPMENFESVKDHILKLASDYKCWDNRITHDEALELCCILEQEPCEDAVSRDEVLKGYIEVDRADGVEIYSEKVVPIEYIKKLPPVTPTHKVESEEK